MEAGESNTQPITAAAANAEASEPEPQPRFSPPAIQTLAPLPQAPDPAPVAAASNPLVPLLKAKLRSPKLQMALSAGLAVLILGAYLAHRGAKAEVPIRPPEIVEHLDLTDLRALPDSLQPGAQALVAGNFQPPAWLQSLDRATGGDLVYPVHEAIDDVQPTLRWSAFASTYNVAVISPAHQVVARAEIHETTSWTLPVELQRGTVYTWEVASLGTVRRNAFRVLDANESGLLNGLKAGHADSHLIMGVALLELGLVSPAQQELKALHQDHPHSPEAAQLWRAVNGLIAN